MKGYRTNPEDYMYGSEKKNQTARREQTPNGRSDSEMYENKQKSSYRTTRLYMHDPDQQHAASLLHWASRGSVHNPLANAKPGPRKPYRSAG